jgi:hypothetical protein
MQADTPQEGMHSTVFSNTHTSYMHSTDTQKPPQPLITTPQHRANAHAANVQQTTTSALYNTSTNSCSQLLQPPKHYFPFCIAEYTSSPQQAVATGKSSHTNSASPQQQLTSAAHTKQHSHHQPQSA